MDAIPLVHRGKSIFPGPGIPFLPCFFQIPPWPPAVLVRKEQWLGDAQASWTWGGLPSPPHSYLLPIGPVLTPYTSLFHDGLVGL